MKKREGVLTIMNSIGTRQSLIEIVRDPILKISRSGEVLQHHLHPECDPVFMDLELLGKNVNEFEFFRDTKDSIAICLDSQEPQTSYFSWAYGGQLKHFEVLIEYQTMDDVLVLIKEITKKKQRENELIEYSDLIQNIYEGTASWTGHDYLDHLTIQLEKSLKSDCTAIFLINESTKELDAISVCEEGNVVKNFSGSIDGSPVKNITSDGLLEVRSGFEKLFPDFFLLKKRNFSGFVGVPIYNNKSENKTIGVMAAMYEEPIKSVRQIDKILEIFSTRAATELERMENLKMIEKNEQKFKALYNNTPSLFNSLDREGNLIEVGDFFLEKTGYLREEVVGQSVFNFVTEESKVFCLKEVFPNFFIDGYCKDIALQFIKKNGKVMDVLFSATVVKKSDGEFEKIVVNLNDVTQLRKIQNELKESEAKVIKAAERYQSLFDNSPVGIIIHTNGVIKHVNSEMIRLARGNSKFDFIGKKALSFVHPDSKKLAEERIKNIYRTKTTHRNEQKFLCVDGSVIEVEAMGILIDYEGKQSIQIAIYDISERKRAQQKILEHDEKLKSLNEHLARQNNQLEEFAHIASHNLRAPITNMLSLIKIRESDPTPENEEFVWTNISKTIQNLDETIIELNDVVKTSWELDKKKNELHFSSILDKILESIGNEVLASNARIESDFDNFPSIYYPKVYLESIMQNLITNALKYADHVRKPHIIISSMLKNGKGILKVQDNGLGIDLDKHGEKLFGLRKTFHDNEDARGVGLFITKAQIESMGGTVEVESKVGEGSTFIINFGKI